jgi:hypothetical protein
LKISKKLIVLSGQIPDLRHFSNCSTRNPFIGLNHMSFMTAQIATSNCSESSAKPYLVFLMFSYDFTYSDRNKLRESDK